MMATMPRYRSYAGGMDGGPDNPLGARIGHAVSSGCIRLFNQDIIDLYNRVPVGAHVMVVQA
jgi:lipoprotein-anchoring transpeptidase ErfK/SrfK